jgi:hypothetical protein
LFNYVLSYLLLAQVSYEQKLYHILPQESTLGICC